MTATDPTDQEAAARDQAHLHFGEWRNHRGRQVLISRNHEALATFLREQRSPGWGILARFSDGGRGSANWIEADGVFLDFDYEDPAAHPDECRRVVPDEVRSALVQSARTGRWPPGVLYPTRRGFRFATIFREPITACDEFQAVVRALADSINAAIRRTNIPSWELFEIGFRFDEGSLQPTHCQDLPLKEMEVVVIDGDLILPEDLLMDDEQGRLDLDAAFLPASPAPSIIRGIADHSQVPPEVVSAKIIATAAGLIGNTARAHLPTQRTVNAAIAIITALESGSGKGDVDQVIQGALKPVRDLVRDQREAAQAAHDDYEAKLEAWRKRNREDAGTPMPQRPFNAHPDVAFQVADVTTEALLIVQQANREGRLLLDAQELEVLTTLLGAYKDKKGQQADRAKLRSILSGEAVDSNRKGGGRISVENPFLAVHAYSQPGVVNTFFSGADQTSGLVARFSLHEPRPLRNRTFLAEDGGLPAHLDEAVTSELSRLFLGLFASDDLEYDPEGWVVPRAIRVSEEAEIFVRQRWQEEDKALAHQPESYRALWGHWRGHVFRYALVLTLLHDPQATAIDVDAVRAALKWRDYFFATHLQIFGHEIEAQAHERRQALQKEVEQQLKAGRPVIRRLLAKKLTAYRRGRGGSEVVGRDLLALGYRVITPTAVNARRGRPTEHWGTPEMARAALRKASEGIGRTDEADDSGVDAADPPVESRDTAPEPRGASSSENAGRFAALFSERDPSSRNTAANQYRRKTPHGFGRRLDFAAANVELLPELRERWSPGNGKRGPCPICGSSKGFAWDDDRTNWTCFSSKHPREERDRGKDSVSGDAIDLALGAKLGRTPTRGERTEFVRRHRGEDAVQSPEAQAKHGEADMSGHVDPERDSSQGGGQ